MTKFADTSRRPGAAYRGLIVAQKHGQVVDHALKVGTFRFVHQHGCVELRGETSTEVSILTLMKYSHLPLLSPRCLCRDSRPTLPHRLQ